MSETLEADFLAQVRLEYGELLKKIPPIRIEEYLNCVPESQRETALPELLMLDLSSADDWGQARLTCEEYVDRLPEHAAQIRQFFAALESHDSRSAERETDELPTPESTAHWRRGLRVGPYELLDPLGQGGFGEVWKARNHSDGAVVAIKSVGPTRRSGQLKSSATVVHHNATLTRERMILAELSGHGLRVPQLLDEGQDGSGRPYIVMQFLPGKDLQRLRETGDWDWRRCVRVTISLLEAVRELHRRGYYHCDLKTRNIMVTPDETVWLIDLGSTLRYNDVVRLGRGYYPPYTKGYAPPEAEIADSGTQINARYDLYNVGVVLYVLLTGRQPGPDETRLRQRYNDESQRIDPQPPSEIYPEIPGSLDDVCLWMLQKSSVSRPRNAQEVLNRLVEVLESGLVTTQPSRVSTTDAAEGQPTRDQQISSTARSAGTTADNAIPDAQPESSAGPRPLAPPAQPPSRGHWLLRIGLGSLGACLFGLLALGWLPGTARNRPLLGLGLMAVPDAGLKVAPEPGNSDAFEPVPQAVHVQGQEGATYSTRPHQDWCQIEADHPQQYLIGRITESRRNFEIEIRMHMEGPVVDLGLSYAPIEEQLVERHSLFWMLHLARLPFDPDEPTRINWKVRFDRYTLTNPPIVPLSDVVRRGLLMVSGEEAPAQGQFPMRTGAPNLPLILRIEQGRLVQMRFDQGVVPIQMPADAPDFQGDLRILVAGAEEAPDPEGRPRPRGLVKIWKPKFSYVD